MNKLLLLAACIFCSVTAFAKIWRVNNNTGINANFTTLQAAHDGAASGDTIYVEASPTNYGGVNCTKKLHITGAGFFLDQNQNLQASAQRSWCSSITFNNGSAGSVIEGMWLNGASVDIRVSNIVVRRNHFGSGTNALNDNYTGNVVINALVSNIIITQNFALSVSAPSYAITGLLITNNYLAYGADYGDATTGSCLELNPNATALVKNNVFRRGRVTLYNSNFSNNIMYAGTFNGTGNLSSNNISNGTQFGTANGNQANVSMASVFELTGSPDAMWKLKVGSPAAGAGYGSTTANPVDCGMFGGTTPYMLSGIPPIPSIYFFANQPVGSNSDPIDVQIKVRSNN